MKRLVAQIWKLFVYALSLYSLGEISFAAQAKTPTVSAKDVPALAALDSCQKEHWEGWCSVAPTTPDADPAPESARSAKCLKTSLGIFHDALDSRHQGDASLVSSASSIDPAKSASAPSPTGINNAQVAAVAYGRCVLDADRLIQYFTAYAQNRESARTFCTQNKSGDDPRTAKIKMTNFETAVNLHRQTYATALPEYATAAGLNSRDQVLYRFNTLARTTTRNYEKSLNSILTAISKDCERKQGRATNQINIATQSKAVTAQQNTLPPGTLLAASEASAIHLAQTTMAPGNAIPTPTGNPSSTTPNITPIQPATPVPLGATPTSPITDSAGNTISNSSAPGTTTNYTAPNYSGNSYRTPTGTTLPRNPQDVKNPSAVGGAGTSVTPVTRLKDQCSALPSNGSLTAPQSDLKARCLNAGFRAGPR